MRHLTKLSGICFILILIGEMLTAFRFLSASQIMDYHQVAMGITWDNLSMGMQTMTINFMRSAGLGFLISGLAILFLLVFPFRRGEQWSKWALVIIIMTQSIVMLAVVHSVKSHTGAEPPLTPFIVSVILSLIGFLTYRGSSTSTLQK